MAQPRLGRSGRAGRGGRSDCEAGADERSDLSRVVREMHAERLCCHLEWNGPQGSVGIALTIVTVPHFWLQSGSECQPYALHGANASGGTRFGRRMFDLGLRGSGFRGSGFRV